MPLLRFAIVGRPNVGKSSIMNMLASRRVSIVDPTPGVTRDRVSAVVTLDPPDNVGRPIDVELTDTGGYGVYTAEGRRIDDAGMDLAALTADIERQIAAAVETADLVLFVVDVQAGVTAQDQLVAKLLREGGLGRHKDGSAKVVLVANKCDGPRWESHVFEAMTLGFPDVVSVSAKNNYMRRDLVDFLHTRAKALLAATRASASAADRPAPSATASPDAPPEMMLAIVGKRNAGKSTLVNALAGEQRVIVSEIAGTTRDAVDVRFELDGRSLVAIDTAGLRRRRSMNDRVEWYALERMLQAIARADVALLMIDATVPLSHVDQQLARALTTAYKPTVIVVNKWDLAEGRPLAGGPEARQGRPVTTGDYERYIREELKGLDFAPIAFMSAQRGRNVRETIDLAFDLYEQSRQRASTGKLNRLIRSILETHAPSSSVGKFAKVYFVAQIATRPPTIVCVVNYPDMFPTNYQRFLLKAFREHLPFPEVPIKLVIRQRQREIPLEPGAQPITQNRPPELRNLPADAAAYFDEPATFAPEPGAPRTPRPARRGADTPAPDFDPNAEPADAGEFAADLAAAETESRAQEADVSESLKALLGEDAADALLEGDEAHDRDADVPEAPQAPSGPARAPRP
ncbi:MAG: ribosome biogenesis GTPase Der, partial [Phycisphaeraceae bacterium]|nr:ribosome biogenesis GTPase Der [Phycisphaeraceae bacterium]